jgi:hypothetical protein
VQTDKVRSRAKAASAETSAGGRVPSTTGKSSSATSHRATARHLRKPMSKPNLIT